MKDILSVGGVAVDNHRPIEDDSGIHLDEVFPIVRLLDGCKGKRSTHQWAVDPRSVPPLVPLDRLPYGKH